MARPWCIEIIWCNIIMSENIDIQLKVEMAAMGEAARSATTALRLADTSKKKLGLQEMAKAIRSSEAAIIKANEKDVSLGKEKGLSDAMVDRLILTPERIDGIASGLEAIAALPDPVGSIDETWTRPNGLKLSKVRTPIGVIGMIYESRPNVTADAAGLCIWSGNACILRGGSEAAFSNRAIHLAIQQGLDKARLPINAAQLVQTTDRAAVGMMLGGLNDNVDLIIPRGGKGLVGRVQTDARVPVLAHLEGLCHSYVHAGADQDKALKLIENAKLRRTGVCGSTETALIDKSIAADFIPKLVSNMSDLGCEIRACETSCEISPAATQASEEDFFTEHLAAILNVKVVDGLQGAINHIGHYGSGHTDCIITEDDQAAQTFLAEIDSAIVVHNASTQFADGGEFGFGAEIGIATGRLHARGPVGAQHLTTYKYTVQGNGQVRP